MTGAARVFCACFPVLAVLWVLLVLYPNPLKLAESVKRLSSPKVDPAAVHTLAESLPSEPVAIERALLDDIQYQYDWVVYGIPWYYPTVDEVIENGRGDCKARAIVLASVLEVKGIPYRIKSSPMHVWVDYEGKGENTLENDESGFYELDPQTGARSLRLPGIDLVEFADVFWQGFWPPMPVMRKVLLISGLIVLLTARVVWPTTGRPAETGLSRSYAPRPALTTQAERGKSRKNRMPIPSVRRRIPVVPIEISDAAEVELPSSAGASEPGKVLITPR
jgi:hypothetical protein